MKRETISRLVGGLLAAVILTAGVFAQGIVNGTYPSAMGVATNFSTGFRLGGTFTPNASPGDAMAIVTTVRAQQAAQALAGLRIAPTLAEYVSGAAPAYFASLHVTAPTITAGAATNPTLSAGLYLAAEGSGATANYSLYNLGASFFAADKAMTMGAGQALYYKSTSTLANTAVAGAIIGTPVVPALHAGSYISANQLSAGDILLATQTGGNTQAGIMIDGTNGQVNLYGAGVKQAQVTATALNLGVAGTTTGTLTLSGSTSGTITVTPAATAGTATLTLPAITGGVPVLHDCGSTGSGNQNCTAAAVSTNTRIFAGHSTLSGSAAVITFPAPAFTATTSYECVANDVTTRANVVQMVTTSSSTATITNTTGATDVISWICAGN
jgi:hypothetical protein